MYACVAYPEDAPLAAAMPLNDLREELSASAAALATPGTGLLAADESTGTIGERFEAIGLADTEEHRRSYRSLLAITSGLAQHISGVILFEETLFQNSNDAGGGASDPVPQWRPQRGGCHPLSPYNQPTGGSRIGPLAPGLLLRSGVAAFLPAALGRPRHCLQPGGPVGQSACQWRRCRTAPCRS
jgi:hypothetical protein